MTANATTEVKADEESRNCEPVVTADTITPGKSGAQRFSWRAIVLISVLALASLAWGTGWLLHQRDRVTTDDAFVDADVAMVMSRLSERVAAVPVRANTYVHRGQLLVVLDDAAAQARLAYAEQNAAAMRSSARAARENTLLEAQVQSAQIATESSRVRAMRRAAEQARAQAASYVRAVSISQAELDMSRATAAASQIAIPAAEEALNKARADERRQEQLARDGYVSASAVESARAAAAQADAAYRAARAQTSTALIAVRTSMAKVNHDRAVAAAAGLATDASLAQVPVAIGNLAQQAVSSRVPDKAATAESAAAQAESAQAQVRLAHLDVEATRIVAPIDGYIATRGVEPGQTVTPGQALITISPAHNLFITANYKETQINRIRAGMPVEIAVDACRGEKLLGRVIGIAPVAQSTLSTLPSLTAPSSFVKVAQRIPIRIEVPVGSRTCSLRPGISVETSIVTLKN